MATHGGGWGSEDFSIASITRDIIRYGLGGGKSPTGGGADEGYIYLYNNCKLNNKNI